MEIEKLFRSYEQAEASAMSCLVCGANLQLAVTAPSFTQFKPFVTRAFNGQPIEVSDRRQLRRLEHTYGMKQMADNAHNYFGSNPKSIPSFDEVARDTSGGPDPKLSKLVRVVDAKEHEVLSAQAEATNFGRSSAIIPESLRSGESIQKRIKELRS